MAQRMFENFDHSYYCSSNNDDWSQLHVTARKFLTDLNLPTTHPLCDDRNRGIFSSDEFIVPAKIEDLSSSDLFYEREMSLWSRGLTIWYQVAPALLAMGELWLRLFAFVLAPAIVLYLITTDLWLKSSTRTKKNLTMKQERNQAYLLLLGLASSLVLLTDTLYVHTYNGRQHGATLFFTMILVTTKRCKKYSFYRKRVFGAMFAMVGLTTYLIAHSDKQGTGIYDNPGLDIPTIQPGFYYSENNKLMSKIAELWPEDKRTYGEKKTNSNNNNPTPYLPTGDALTGIPFLVNKVDEQSYHRVWVQNKVDKEAVALDIQFPPDGVHSTRKPIFLILHGLNGGSHEEYVREMVGRRTVEGHTCIVMIARGLMDTPIIGWNVFHGARIIDIDSAAKSISKVKGKNQILAGVGYSMGAIVLSNYVARSGANCHLDAAMAVSGGLDMREMLNFKRGKRLWQPMLAQTLRDDFIVTKFDHLFRRRLSAEEHLKLMRSTSVSEIDTYAIVSYNNFDDLEHYYTEMSAMGDTNAFKAETNSSSLDEDFGRIANVSIPLCVLHALDDPLVTWRTIGHNPAKLVDTGSGHIMMVLTKSGGHVGWPYGLNPRRDGWKFMNDAAASFANSVDTAKNDHSL